LKAAIKTIELNLEKTCDKIVEALNQKADCHTSLWNWLNETVNILTQEITNLAPAELKQNNSPKKSEAFESNMLQAIEKRVESTLS